MPTLGLFARIALSLTLILSAAMLALGYAIVADDEQQIQQERMQLVTASAATLAQGSLDALVTGDYELLERWVSSVLLGDFYAYAFLARADGQILTHSDLAQVAHYTDPVGPLDTRQIRTTIYKDQLVREVIYPAMLGGRHLANAHVGYYPNRAALKNPHSLKIVLLIVVSLLLMLGATLLIVRRHTRPVSQLTDYVTRLSLETGAPGMDPRLLQHRDEIGMLSRAFDAMTRRLQAAFAELQQEETRLRERVDEQTQSLQQANKELEAFSYSVSHDLRAPLRAIDGFSQILSEDYEHLLDADGQDSIKRIRLATQRMGSLIDDLLELSRISQTPLVKVEVDLSALANDIARDLSTVEPDRAVSWRIAPNVQVRGDRNLLRILMVNLLGNAWKYSANVPQATIEFGAISTGSGKTCFIRDNGAGFDMQYQEKLFKPFSRLHGRAEFEGTGIGLATVQRILNRHGGKIWAEGRLNEGACFYFQLPD